MIESLFKKPKKINKNIIDARKRMLAAVPIHSDSYNPEILDNGQVSFTISRKKSWFATVFVTIFFVSGEKKLTLDKVGSYVWKLCDGSKSVAEIAVAMKEEFKLTRKEAQVSVIQFVQTLMKKGVLSVKVTRKKPE